MRVEFVRLSEIDRKAIIALNNHPSVLRHMPLAGAAFDDDLRREWVASKKRQWDEHGYGPWAFLIDGHFAGWGGLQYENGDADLALVLHPDYWGCGKRLFHEVTRRAFGPMGLESITILLPESRRGARSLCRLGFQNDGTTVIDKVTFLRYRLLRGKWNPVPANIVSSLCVANATRIQ